MDSQSAIFTGKSQDVCLPSGRVVTIRETNGNDDETLSQLASSKTGENVLAFLADIITGIKVPEMDAGKKVTAKDIAAWPISDKYYLVFKQRLLNLGTNLTFTFGCVAENCGQVFTVEEELSDFDGDLFDSKYEPKKLGAVRKSPNPLKSEVTFQVGSASLKFRLLDSSLESAQLALPEETTNKNTILLSRELSRKDDSGKYVRVTSFHSFSSKEMLEIRNMVKKSDPEFSPHVSFTCPKCKSPYSLPVLGIPAFFWPEETM